MFFDILFTEIQAVFIDFLIQYFLTKKAVKFVSSNHSYTKRNSLDARVVFKQWRNVCILKGQIFQNIFEELQTGDGIEGILAFLHNNIITVIATDEQFRDWTYRYYFWNTFWTNIAEKRNKTQRQSPRDVL